MPTGGVGFCASMGASIDGVVGQCFGDVPQAAASQAAASHASAPPAQFPLQTMPPQPRAMMPVPIHPPSYSDIAPADLAPAPAPASAPLAARQNAARPDVTPPPAPQQPAERPHFVPPPVARPAQARRHAAPSSPARPVGERRPPAWRSARQSSWATEMATGPSLASLSRTNPPTPHRAAYQEPAPTDHAAMMDGMAAMQQRQMAQNMAMFGMQTRLNTMNNVMWNADFNC